MPTASPSGNSQPTLEAENAIRVFYCTLKGKYYDTFAQ